MTVNARESLTRALGTSAVPVTVELHDTLDQFRLEVRRPWWVSAAVKKIPELIQRVDDYYPPRGAAPPPPPLPDIAVIEQPNWWGYAAAGVIGAVLGALLLFVLG